MKVTTDVFPIQELKGNEKAARGARTPAQGTSQQDRVTLSHDDVRHVIDENKAAAEVELIDVYRAEDAVHAFENRAAGSGTREAATIEQLDGKRVLFLALD